MEEEYIEPITSEELQSIFGTNFITKEEIEIKDEQYLHWCVNSTDIIDNKVVLTGRLFPHQFEEIRKLSGIKAEKKFLELVQKNKEKYNFNQC